MARETDAQKAHESIRMAYACFNHGLGLLVQAGELIEKLAAEKEEPINYTGPGTTAEHVYVAVKQAPTVFKGAPAPVPAPAMMPKPLDVASREQLVKQCLDLGFTEKDTRAKKVKELKDMIARGQQAAQLDLPTESLAAVIAADKVVSVVRVGGPPPIAQVKRVLLIKKP